MTTIDLPQSLYELIADSILDTWASLPLRGKPRTRSNGAQEWTVLAGFCIYPRDASTRQQFECVSIGTGLKALPHSKLPKHGDLLHDSHGEIIARRGFVRYLLSQVELAMTDPQSSCLARAPGGKWKLKDELRLGMYVSTLPCGDASTYTLSLQSPAIQTAPPARPSKPDKTNSLPSTLAAASLGLHTSRSATHTSANQVHRGRIAYGALPGTLRTKPGRLDSIPTISHSCSDKLALWSVVGIQGGLLAALGMDRIRTDCLVVGGVENEEKARVRAEVGRAVGGRIGDWEHRGWSSKIPDIGFCKRIFEFDRDVVKASRGEGEVVSAAENVSYIAGQGVELICNGTRMGGKMYKLPGGPLSSKTRSRICKLNLLERCCVIAEILGLELSSSLPYYSIKCDGAASLYSEVKRMLREQAAPLCGWLVSGPAFESFDRSGRIDYAEEAKAVDAMLN